GWGVDVGGAGDRQGGAGFCVVVGIVVVRALNVQPQIDDRAKPPPLVLGIALVGLARQLQRALAETAIGREEQVALEIEALFGIEKWLGVGAVPSPAVGPVVVAGN